MATTAASIVKDAGIALQDEDHVRWTKAELVGWLNDAEKAAATLRPDAFAQPITVTCVEGPRQVLPASAIKLIDIVNNAAGAKAAIRQVPRDALDEHTPGWYAMAPAAAVKHFTYDPRDPRTFYVYPPAIAGVAVNAVCALYPAPIVEPEEGDEVEGNITAPDFMASALLDAVLARAYMKDADYAGNPAKATAHYQAFTAALGVDAQTTLAIAPKAGNEQPATAAQ